MIRTADTRSDPRWPRFMAKAREHGVLSQLCIPLWVDERSLGTLSLYAGDPMRPCSTSSGRQPFISTVRVTGQPSGTPAVGDRHQHGDLHAVARHERHPVRHLPSAGVQAVLAFGPSMAEPRPAAAFRLERCP